MFITLVSVLLGIFIPLLIGYRFKQHQLIERNIGPLLRLNVILLITAVGIAFGLDPNISNLMQSIGSDSLQFFSVLIACNLIALLLLTWVMPQLFSRHNHKTLSTPKKVKLQQLSLASTFQQAQKILGKVEVIIVLVLGYFIGQYVPIPAPWVDNASYLLLFIMFILVGIELRLHNIVVHTALINTRGLLLALTILASSWGAAIIMTSMNGWELKNALAVASGFGWSSLSGTMITQLVGPQIGGVALIIDLAREIMIICCLPWIVRQSSALGVGLSGATAMDVSLPFLQQAYGVKVVPSAMSCGLALTVLSPIIIGSLLG